MARRAPLAPWSFTVVAVELVLACHPAAASEERSRVGGGGGHAMGGREGPASQWLPGFKAVLSLVLPVTKTTLTLPQLKHLERLRIARGEGTPFRLLYECKKNKHSYWLY
jgi:hypothetical protein